MYDKTITTHTKRKNFIVSSGKKNKINIIFYKKINKTIMFTIFCYLRIEMVEIIVGLILFC